MNIGFSSSLDRQHVRQRFSLRAELANQTLILFERAPGDRKKRKKNYLAGINRSSPNTKYVVKY